MIEEEKVGPAEIMAILSIKYFTQSVVPQFFLDVPPPPPPMG